MNSNVPSTSVESWIGRNALAVVAAGLILLGLILLGATLIPFLPNAAKAALVFVFSGLLTAIGVFATRRKPSVLSTALFFCGVAALLVSIVLARYSFNVFDNTTTFIALVVWAFASLGLAWFTRSVVLAGMVLAVSSVFGFEYLDLLSPMPGIELIVFLVFIAAFAVTAWHLVFKRNATKYADINARNAYLAILVCSEVALFLAAVSSSFQFSFEVVVVLTIAILLALAFAPFTKTDVRYYFPVRVNEIVVILISALVVSLANQQIPSLMCYGAAGVGIAALTVIRIRELSFSEQGSAARTSALLVLAALAPTFYLLGFLYGCTHLVDEPYAYSVVMMACALAMIGVGFAFQASPIRLTGLVLVLLCVVKLVTIDIVGLSSLARVAAFVIGGLICFAISALYHRAQTSAR